MLTARARAKLLPVSSIGTIIELSSFTFFDDVDGDLDRGYWSYVGRVRALWRVVSGGPSRGDEKLRDVDPLRKSSDNACNFKVGF